jgi:hypothetical protein
MPDWLQELLPSAVVAAISATGGWLAARVNAGSEYVKANLSANTESESDALTAQNLLIDQLQEELKRFRERTDERLSKLEAENTAYRRALIEHRDYMVDHHLQPPTWPVDIPR